MADGRPSLTSKLQLALMQTTQRLKKPSCAAAAATELSPALERQCYVCPAADSCGSNHYGVGNGAARQQEEGLGGGATPSQEAILAYFARLLSEQDADDHRHYTFSDVLAYQVMHNELATLIGEKPEFTDAPPGGCAAAAAVATSSAPTSPHSPFHQGIIDQGTIEDLFSSPDPDAGTGGGAVDAPPLAEVTALFVACGSAIVTNNRNTAIALLKRIRAFSTPFGSSLQRLGHYFGEALTARLSNRGVHILMNRKEELSTFNSARTYEYICSKAPYYALAHHFQNSVFLETMQGAERVHIIDYGISNGYQWPSFMQALACRPGGPPELLRITGIEFPQPGGHPDKRIKETGHRLARFAATFGIPFEYNAIACVWEDVPITSLGLRHDEALAVSSIFRLRHIYEETAMPSNPRSQVLRKICSMNPKAFLIGVMSWSSNSPYFLTRLREAIPFYHCYFDATEVLMPRDNMHRLNLEAHIFGHDILNALACEGLDRRERPEHYTQWDRRLLNAGFEPIPMSEKTYQRTAEIMPRYNYHKDFVISRDSSWMLLGWRNTFHHGLAAWRPRRV